MLYLYLDLFCFAFFVTKKNKMVYMLKSVLLLSVIWVHVKREREKKPQRNNKFQQLLTGLNYMSTDTFFNNK